MIGSSNPHSATCWDNSQNDHGERSPEQSLPSPQLLNRSSTLLVFFAGNSNLPTEVHLSIIVSAEGSYFNCPICLTFGFGEASSRRIFRMVSTSKAPPIANPRNIDEGIKATR